MPLGMRKLRFEKSIGLHRVPRFVGIDQQLAPTVDRYQELLKQIDFMGLIPFVSIYSFPKMVPAMNGQFAPTEVLIDKIFHDIDVDAPDVSKTSSMDDEEVTSEPCTDIDIDTLEEARKTVCDMGDHIKEFGMEPHFVFSGRKGFHIHTPLKPERYPIHDSLYSQDTTDKIYSMQVFLDSAGIADFDCFGMFRGLMRIPNFRYFGKVGRLDTWTIPLTYDEIHSWSVNKIMRVSREGARRINMPESSKLLSLSQFVKEHTVEIKTSRVRYTGEENNNYPQYPIDSSAKTLLAGLLSYRPCISNAAFTENPSHLARRNLVIYLSKEAELPQKQIEGLFAGLGWSDYKPKITRDQIKSILGKSDVYKCPRCRKLQSEGFCMGEKCRFYMGLRNQPTSG